MPQFQFRRLSSSHGEEPHAGLRSVSTLYLLSMNRPRKLLPIAVGTILLIAVALAITVIYTISNKSNSATGSWEPKYVSPSVLGKFKQAAVSSNGPECSQIGADIMQKKNGSVVDAAIATLFCEGVASIQSMGIGGGFFMTIYNATEKKAYFLNARETAPAKATEDMYHKNSTQSFKGGLSVAVPGELMGYWEAHKRFGRLEWKELIEPTIELCKKGSIITEYLGAILKTKEAEILAEPTMAEILIDPKTNKVLKAGDRIKRLKLAKTLELIAENGIGEFYNGTMADDLVREIKEFGGIITKEDFKNYRVKWSEPSKANIKDMTLYSAPLPGSGPVLTFILNILDNIVPYKDEGITWQRIIESYKWGYAMRTELGDPDFVNMTGYIANLTSKEFAASIRKQIEDSTTFNDVEHYGVKTSGANNSGTAHISLIGPDGSAVAATSTVNYILGAMIRSKSTGIIFNDEMDDFGSPGVVNAFGVPPSPSNFIRPGKRPMSSMAPSIFVDKNGQVRLVVGAAGGTKITTAVALVSVLNLWSDYNIKEAVDTMRVHHQLMPMVAQNEKNFSPKLIEFLQGIGHNVSTYPGIGSAVTAVARENGEITANSDFRRQGTVAGF